MASLDWAWDEDRSGPRDPQNLISAPVDGLFTQATAKILPWKTPGPHDDPAQRRVIASIYLEQLFRLAPVPHPESLHAHRFMTKCLGLKEYLQAAAQLLVDEGLVRQDNVPDDDREDDELACADDLVRRADEIIKRCIDDPILEVNEESFDWLEGHGQTAHDQVIDEFAEVDLAQLTRRTNDLSVYIVLGQTTGHRSTQAIRTKANSTFNIMVGGDTGGQLASAIKMYTFPASMQSVQVTLTMLWQRIPDFFLNTQWPKPYRRAFDDMNEYIFDLPRRASAKTATRNEWMAIVLNDSASFV
jgi:hypothetical protein